LPRETAAFQFEASGLAPAWRLGIKRADSAYFVVIVRLTSAAAVVNRFPEKIWKFIDFSHVLQQKPLRSTYACRLKTENGQWIVTRQPQNLLR
jgi:hypothetical protein